MREIKTSVLNFPCFLNFFQTRWSNFTAKRICEIAKSAALLSFFLFTMRTRGFPPGCFRSVTIAMLFPSNCSGERKNTCLRLSLRCPFDVSCKEIFQTVSAFVLVLHSGLNSCLFLVKIQIGLFIFCKVESFCVLTNTFRMKLSSNWNCYRKITSNGRERRIHT